MRIIDRLRLDNPMWLVGGVCAAIVLNFYAPFLWMLNQWFVIEEYSPGPAVPILASIALWHALKKHGALPKIPRRTAQTGIVVAVCLAALVYIGKEHSRLLPGSKILSPVSYVVLFAAMTFALLWSGTLLSGATREEARKRGGGMGLAVILLSLAVHFLALRGDLDRACIAAYVTVLFGTAWYVYGWATARRLAFPYAMLFLMIPIQFIDEIVGVPLRVMATNAAVFLMRVAGLQVVQKGNWFAIGSMEFTVDAPCSGLKSLIALAALGATFAYMSQPNFVKKVLLGSCAIPIALLTNIVRLACVGIFAQLLGKDFAVMVFHDNAAVFLYILAILILILLDRKVFQAEWFRIRNF